MSHLKNNHNSQKSKTDSKKGNAPIITEPNVQNGNLNTDDFDKTELTNSSETTRDQEWNKKKE